jgi:putative membrane protein
MKQGSKSRRPIAFRLDDPGVSVTLVRTEIDEQMSQSLSDAVDTLPAASAAAIPTAARSRSTRHRAASLGTLFFAATGGLVALGLGLAATRLIQALFERAEWLGWLGSGLAAAASAALAAIIVREIAGLARLNAVERLQARAAAALAADDRNEAEIVVRDLLRVLRFQPRLARSRAAMHEHLSEIIDGADLIRLAEREMIGPLDLEARRSVADAAKRVSLVTAISPRAAVDMIFVLVTALALVRHLSNLYGSRPGTLGLIRLVRQAIAHLAVTGGMAAGDGLIQQLLGHGVAAKLSARLGEGVINGLLTARLGLAAIEVTRPLPFSAFTPPALADIATGLLNLTPRKPEHGLGQ